MNSMCLNCARLNAGCSGENKELYSGCVYKVVRKIKIHFHDVTHDHKEFKTRDYGIEHIVYIRNGKSGIDWNGEFTPLESFSTENGAIVFEEV